jgi:uncharacterized phage protein (TIGR01671 family)
MRTFKFRVWNQKDKEWENPSILEVFDRSGIFRPLYDPREDYIITQSTNAKDKNGAEIYEGDIIKVERSHTKDIETNPGVFSVQLIEDGEEIGYVLWDWSLYRFSVGFKRYDDYDDFTGGHRSEVVGNIFENTELVPWYPK